MTILYFVLLIGVLIFVHEMGHFLFAKLFDVKVHKFSLGFGPRALGFRKGETDYCVAWIPLGGFVKMLGEDPNDEIRPEDQGRAFHQKPLWQRYIIVLAGPAFNLIFPTLIYFVFFATQTTMMPATVGKVCPGHPAAQADLKPGDRIVAINGEKVRYWEDMQTLVAQHPGEMLRFTVDRDNRTFDRLITPQEKVSRNRLDIQEREGRIGISSRFELAQIGISDPKSPAARAGLKTGDLITSVNGVAVERWAQLEELLARNRGQSLHISYLRPSNATSPFFDLRSLLPSTTILDPTPIQRDGKTNYETGLFSAEFFVGEVVKGSPAEKIGMKSGDRIVGFNQHPLECWESIEQELETHPKNTHTIRWIPYGGKEQTKNFKLALVTLVDEYRQERQAYVFGARDRLLRKNPDPIPIEDRFSFALTRSVGKTGEIVGVMAIAFVQLFRGAIPRDSIGGPIMLYYTAGVAAQKGWNHFLWMMALISINLGILNLLPIPILDGGHIFFFTVEAIKRKPLSLRAREIASYLGLIFLISLMIFAFKNDIVRYWFK